MDITWIFAVLAIVTLMYNSKYKIPILSSQGWKDFVSLKEQNTRMWRAIERFCSFPKGQTHTYITKKARKKSILLLHYVFKTKARLLWGLWDQPEDKYAAALFQTDCLKKILLLSTREQKLRQTYSERQERTVSNQFNFLRGYVKNNSNCRSQDQ